MTPGRVRQSVLRQALQTDSSLQQSVRDALGAVLVAHRGYFDTPIRPSFDDSLNLDEAMRVGHEQENRWDYLLGHRPSGEIVAVEPHSAKQHEVSTIVRKLTAAKQHVRPHLRDGVSVARWLWVASGNVQFANTEKTMLYLAQNGIQFVGRRIMAKHLAKGQSTPAARQTRRRR